MKKLGALFLILAVMLAFSNASYSQPKFTVHLTGGYNLPFPDLKGNFPDSLPVKFPDSANYQIKQGFNFGLAGKYALGKKGNIRIGLGFNYNMFSQKKDYTVGTSTVTFNNKMNIININLGGEYAIMPKGKVNPFLGLDLAANLFSGNLEITGDTLYAGNSDLKSESRFGLGIGGGIDFAFSKNIGAVIGFKYHLANLIGKSYDSANTVKNTQGKVTQYALDDKDHTVTVPGTGIGGTGTTQSFSAKSISYLQIYGGVSFYLGHPKKKSKK